MQQSVCLLLILVIIAVHVSGNLAADICPVENCLPSNQCDSPWVGAVCADKKLSCCSVVNEKYRKACRHYGAECLKDCHPTLRRPATDCQTGEVCCVLV